MSTLVMCKPLFPEYSIPYLFLECNIFLIKYVNFLTEIFCRRTRPHEIRGRVPAAAFENDVKRQFVRLCRGVFPFVGRSAKLVVFTIYW